MTLWDKLKPLEGPGPKYESIFAALSEAIASGDLSPGKRLPSHRLLAQKLGVSVGTVSRAYEEALERGLVTGQVGRGTFVSRHPPPPFRVVASSRIPAGCLDLYQNFPVPLPELEGRAWSDALTRLQREHDLAALARKSFSEVYERHGRAGAAWVARVGLSARPTGILDCPGMQAALSAILGAVTQPGDVLLAAALSHPCIKLLAEHYSLKRQPLATDEEGIDVEALEAACRPGGPKLLYCAPTIQSPTAATMSEERRRAIAEVARRHDLLIIEDESAAFLLEDPLPPIAIFAPERTLFLADVWMALSLGLRTTYVVIPPALHGAIATAVAANSGTTPALIAEIAAMWIEDGVAETLIRARRAELNARNALARELLGNRQLRSHPAGHHLWLELPEPWRSDLFVLRAEQRGIAINGAEWFVFAPGPVPQAVRICIGNAPGREELGRALAQLDGLIDEPTTSGRPDL